MDEDVNPLTPESSRRILTALRDAADRLAAVTHAKSEPLAIVGMSCRFPGGADNPDTCWELLANGRDATRDVPPDRWDVAAHFDPQPGAPGRMYTRRGGFLDRVDGFDAAFFEISPREAVSLDPQQRLLLEVAWEALEDAGHPPERLTHTRAGVFVGITTTDYFRLLSQSPELLDAYAGTGNTLNAAAGRLSYVLGLNGPSLAVDTACSSSLVAVHLACQSLRAGECDVALAGGVNLILSPDGTIALCQAKMLAPDGRCKTFDSRADGYARGEGCAVVVLKRLSDAHADGDRILACIRGSAVNQDGATSGFTVPNGVAQQALLREALRNARLEPGDIDYVEAHGTGTSLGDPIELTALAEVLGHDRSEARPLVVGSVKTNVGHLESAAGIAGLIKVVLALQHATIPPHLHFEQPNAHFDWPRHLIVPTSARPWPTTGMPRRAGVSAFGASGTNAHVIVEEAPVNGMRQGAPDVLDLPVVGADLQREVRHVEAELQKEVRNVRAELQK